MNSFMLCSKDTVTDAPVVVRKQAEDVAPEKKPTPIRAGYWRNRWHSTRGWGRVHRDNIIIDPLTHFSGRKYPSRELAEAYAHRKMRDEIGAHYLGIVTHTQVFFPTDGGAS